MPDPLCVLMGVIDLIAGILILVGFGSHAIGIVFGLLVMGKGAMSFIG